MRAVRSPAPSLDLPPPYRLVRLRERADAFAEACRMAPGGGAGTFVHAGRFDVAEFAVVLEPEEPLAGARRAFFAGMSALADAVSAHCPPETPVGFDWPDALRVDGALIGGGRLGWPPGCPEETVPDWLVFGAMLNASLRHLGDPGSWPGATSLEEEGIEDVRAVLGSFARHLMLAFDAWAEDGFPAIEGAYLARLPKERAGDRLGLEASGDLVVGNEGRRGATERRPLLPALAAPSWLDPERGAPRLGPGPRREPRW